MHPKRFKLNALAALYLTIGFISAFLIFGLTYFGIKESINKHVILIISLILIFYYRKGKEEKRIINLILGILIFLIILFFYEITITYFRIPQWDFACFYLFGKMGTSGLDFYDPRVSMQVFNTLTELKQITNQGFIHEIVNVGFWYPPPSMLLFLPLGVVALKTSYFIWQTVMILFLLADIFLLWKYYSLNLNPINKNSNLNIYALFILLLLSPHFLNSIQTGQTLTLFLFLLILFIKYSDNWKSGLILVFLITVKPLAIIFVLYFLLFKKWKILFSFLVSGIIVVLISLLFFGHDSFVNYFTSPPTSRIPIDILYEDSNQSLNNLVYKLQQKVFGHVDYQKIKIITLIISMIILAATCYFSKLLARKSKIISFLIFIPMALMIYPNTQYPYMLLLLPVILVLFNENLFSHPLLNFVSLFFLYSLGHYSLFLLNLVLWLIFVSLVYENQFRKLLRNWLKNLFLMVN